MPYSAPRRARCAACALATSVLVGMQPVVDAGAADQLALDHRDGLPGGGQPAGQRWPGLAGTDDDRVEMLCHECCQQQIAADQERRSANPPKIATASSSSAIGRSCPPLAATSALARLIAAQGAEHRADDAGAERDERVSASTLPMHRAGERARDEPGGELRRRRAARRLRQLVGDQFDRPARTVRTVDGDGWPPSTPMCRRRRSSPGSAPQATTAGAVRARRPATTPISRASSRTRTCVMATSCDHGGTRQPDASTHRVADRSIRSGRT